MKETTFLMISLSLALLSCRHIAIYKDSNYIGSDSPYPTTQNMQFAYYAGDKKLSTSIKQIGNNIFDDVQEDSCFSFYLPSAEQYEIDNDTFKTYRATYLETIENCSDVLISMRSSSNHKSAIDNGREQLNKLSVCAKYNFNDYWKRIYQLSHRGILQHYMTSNPRYNGLSNTDKSILYGYLLEKDYSKCIVLASIAVSKEKEVISDLETRINSEVMLHEETVRREEAERERKRQEAEQKERERRMQQERLERERRMQQERLERERRRQQKLEAARRRWNDDSWMNGHWILRTQVGKIYSSINLYIDAYNKTIKVYTTVYDSNFPIPKLEYKGSYRIHNGSDYGSRYSGYKAISFGDTVIFADPDVGKLCDGPDSYYYEKM